MKREEALRIIKECKEKGFKHTFYTLNEYHTALDIAIKALEQEPCKDADVKLIHTQGLDEGIRCAMCTNLMANDRGCDGACVVNEIMYKKVLDVIRKQIIDKGEL